MNTIIINGVTYHSVEEMPPEARAKYEQTLAQLAERNSASATNLVGNADDAAPAAFATASSVASPAAATNPPKQSAGPIVTLTIMALGLVIIIAIMLFLLMARGR